ncbi:transcription initiation factor TFIID subunit 3 [Galleria mellonella]|uniref:Transcription initiation factor TFIID subunit 3 n=1 Tax=Galleria mellonella TaxID=7137 RepID=A0ABM3N3B6_GALME|nr:transcription initiation factor TFIID subunit 3 [Galleria mellonella]
MSEAYAREILRRNVAQICQTIGWNGINSTPLDILVHVLEKYIQSLGTQASRYAEQFNRTEPNLHDLGLVFRDLHVQLPELAEYTRCVPSVAPPVNVERFPKPKESNLNFLKPGSHEVVTRPMHVHEHLPPMYPEKERDTPVVAGTIEIHQNGIDNNGTNPTCTSPEISVTDSPEKPKDIFKRPIDPVSLPNNKRPRFRLEEEERTREISSVMMTMSGFLSPAREGKLPEARPPTIVSEKHYDKHKPNSHQSNPMKVPIVDKSDKKSKKNKLLNGKIMKSKRKDKSHKSDSSKSKDSKLNKYPPGHPMKSKEVHPTLHNHVAMLAPRPLVPPAVPPSVMPPPPTPVAPELIRPVIKQEPIDPPSVVPRSYLPGEEAIPVPRKIPISKSPLVSNSIPVNKQTNSFIPDLEIKKEVYEEEKLASQPDRSKINIFKRISNKSKEDKTTPEVVAEKSQSDSMISRLQNSVHENAVSNSRSHENIRIKPEDPIVNNNDNSAVNLSVVDIRSNEVISIDDDSMDFPTPLTQSRPPQHELCPSLSINKSLQAPFSKNLTGPKVKKEKKHKEKKDKVAKLEAKLLKKQQQQILEQMDKQVLKMSHPKPPKSRAKGDSKMPLPPGFPYFPNIPGRGLMPGPGLIPNPGLIPGTDFLAGLANNPALRGLGPSNLLSNPFAGLGVGGPGIIPGAGFLPSSLGTGLPNPLMSMGNFPHSSRSPSMKIPSMLRRPSLEVIPVDNDDDRGLNKTPLAAREKDRHDKHKSPTIPNILQKHKSKSHKDHKSSLFKMPPVQPDITIELNPPKVEPARHEPPREPPRARSPPPEPAAPPAAPATAATAAIPAAPVAPALLPEPEPASRPAKEPLPEVSHERETENTEKKKDKSHKKEKKDKDGTKIKKKKDKKDKNKDKGEKRKDKEEKHELKDKIKKEKKEKKREKPADGLVPKLTLKLSSSRSNSNSPLPPPAPLPPPTSPARRGASPELAQIAALVTRPPRRAASPPPAAASPPRLAPAAKYKRILFKPLSKKGAVEHFDDDLGSLSDDGAPPPPPAAAAPPGQLPTPYYVDEHGTKIWVCPACGRPDNGSPMIGCDGCDGWYHWVCVGITEEPGASEDWFCSACVAKRAALLLAGVPAARRRGRKPKADKGAARDCH